MIHEPISKIFICYFIKISVTPNPISTSTYFFTILPISHWVKKEKKKKNFKFLRVILLFYLLHPKKKKLKFL